MDRFTRERGQEQGQGQGRWRGSCHDDEGQCRRQQKKEKRLGTWILNTSRNTCFSL